jgi:hypothetical protein
LSSLEGQIAPQNSFVSIKLIVSIRTAHAKLWLSFQCVSKIIEGIKGAIPPSNAITFQWCFGGRGYFRARDVSVQDRFLQAFPVPIRPYRLGFGLRLNFNGRSRKIKSCRTRITPTTFRFSFSRIYSRFSGNLLARPKDPELAENRRPATGLPD